MSTAVLDTLRAQRDEARDLAIAMAEGDDFDPTSPDFTDLQTRAEALDKRIDVLVKAHESRNAALALDARIGSAVQSRSKQEHRQERPQSLGEVFVRSEQFQQYPGRGTMAGVTLDMLETRAPLDLGDFSSLNATWRMKDDRPLLTPVIDSATVIPVVTNSIDVVQIEMTENNAAVVAEGAAKPESTFAETITPFVLDTVAHWTQMTRQLIEDSGAVRAAVERKLVRGVSAKLEAEAAAVVAGGTYPTAVDADLLTAIRIGIGDLQDNGFNPNVAYLNPADWAALDVAVQGSRTDGGSGVMQQTYWGLRVVPCSALAAGTALVADSAEAFEVYRRTGVNTYITDSHASTFTSNVFTLLAEARQKTVVADASAVRQTAAA